MEKFDSIKPRKANVTGFFECKRFFISEFSHDTSADTVRGLRLSHNGSKMCSLL
jgi:hypothetical protein